MSVRRRLTEPPLHFHHLGNQNNASHEGGDVSSFSYDNISGDDSASQGVYSPLDNSVSGSFSIGERERDSVCSQTNGEGEVAAIGSITHQSNIPIQI